MNHPDNSNVAVFEAAILKVDCLVMAPITRENYPECIKTDVDGNVVILYSAPNTVHHAHIGLNNNVMKPGSGLIMFEYKAGESARRYTMLTGQFEEIIIEDIPVDQRPDWQNLKGANFRAVGIKWSSAVPGNRMVQGTDVSNMEILEHLYNTRRTGVPFGNGRNGITIQARCGCKWERNKAAAVEVATV
jgi:hypothetical protein